ncbi:MAG: U32 family peptidase [Eggerthella lenta]
MTAYEFSVPFNGDPGTLDALLKLRGRDGNAIREVYLNAPQSVTGSGRVGAETTERAFVETVERIHDGGVRADITMNSTCEGAEWYDRETVSRQVGFVRRMHEERGVEAVTLANPFLIERVRDACPAIEISASVLADIDCFSRAEAYARAGASTVTVDTSANKDLKLLRQMTDRLGVEIKLMVNEGCLDKCPYRKFHMNYISHKSRRRPRKARLSRSPAGHHPARSGRCSNRTGCARKTWYAMRRSPFFKIVGRDMLPSKICAARKLSRRVLRGQPVRHPVQQHRLLRHRAQRARGQQGARPNLPLQADLDVQSALPHVHVLRRSGPRSAGIRLGYPREPGRPGALRNHRGHRGAVRRALSPLPRVRRTADRDTDRDKEEP